MNHLLEHQTAPESTRGLFDSPAPVKTINKKSEKRTIQSKTLNNTSTFRLVSIERVTLFMKKDVL